MIGRASTSRPIAPTLERTRLDMPAIIKALPRRNPVQQDTRMNRSKSATTSVRMPYSVFKCLLFAFSVSTLLFAMCATGRASA